MSNTITAPAAKKSAYKRPYKTRSERREVDRRKHDEAKDYKFLWRVAAGVGVLLLIALAFTFKGVIEIFTAPIPKATVEAVE